MLPSLPTDDTSQQATEMGRCACGTRQMELALRFSRSTIRPESLVSPSLPMEAFYLRPQVTVPSSYDACAKISDYEMFKEYLLVTGEWAFKLDATTSVMPEADEIGRAHV